MTEPRTEAGKRLLRSQVLSDHVTPELRKTILAIEAEAAPSLDEGLREALERLPRVRLTGEQLDAIDPDPEKHAWVDWDEYEEFVSLSDVRATLATRACRCTADASLFAGGVCPACGHRDHGASGCEGDSR